ncbi:MAG: flagellar motor switch protein FliM [Candidatus Marinimicrobia bacterium]|nr:flagellar motor switch protein FliM [Candidatus Neomarinimicrobiota bacterium]
MNKVLSQEEIDALLTSVGEGEDAEKAQAQIQKEKKVTLYDFKRPHHVSKEQLRLLDNIHEALISKLGVFLSAQLKMIVEMDLIGIDQIMYSEFVMSISSPSALYVGEFDNPYSKFILEISPQFIASAIERLFGGQGTYTSTNHRVSTIEQKIMERIIDKIALEISNSWDIVQEFGCEFNRFEHNAEFVQIASASEPVIVVSIEVKLRDHTTMMNICYPHVWISEILSNPNIQNEIMLGNQSSEEGKQEVVEQKLYNTPTNLRAILGKTKLSVQDFIELQKGDVITLDKNLGENIMVYAQNQSMFEAQVGKKRKNYAIKISDILKGENNED